MKKGTEKCLFKLLWKHRAEIARIILLYTKLPSRIYGFYYSHSDFKTITISKYLSTSCERCSVLAEELGHHFTTPIDLFKTSKTNREKYEHSALAWAVNEMVPLQKLIDAWLEGIRSSWELAEYLDVTERFLRCALKIHEEKHGLKTKHNKYVIEFSPLKIKEAVSG